MTALALVQSTVPADPAVTRDRLVDLVKAADGLRGGVEAGLAIAADPALKAVASDMLRRLDAEVQPACEADAVRELRRLIAVYHVADGKNKDWNDFWSIYYRALDDLSLSCIRAGVDKFIKESTSDYFPKPGTIRELCMTRVSDLSYYRAVIAFGLSAEPIPDDTPPYRRERMIELLMQSFVRQRATAPTPLTPLTPLDLGFV